VGITLGFVLVVVQACAQGRTHHIILGLAGGDDLGCGRARGGLLVLRLGRVVQDTSDAIAVQLVHFRYDLLGVLSRAVMVLPRIFNAKS